MFKEKYIPVVEVDIDLKPSFLEKLCEGLKK